MRTNVPNIFAIGDIADEPMLAHKAVHQGHVAAENAAGKKSFFDARQIPSVAYTDPEIAWAGLTETEAKARGVPYKKAVFPWAASGRAIANGRDEGFTKLLFDERTEQIIGGAIVGTEAGNLISEICLAIEMGADAVDIGKTIHPHPTLVGIDRHGGGSGRKGSARTSCPRNRPGSGLGGLNGLPLRPGSRLAISTPFDVTVGLVMRKTTRLGAPKESPNSDRQGCGPSRRHQFQKSAP